ncbi:cytidine deaminase [Sphingobium sp.]|uniref:cytidine deaminase n=1 Tax=Sphingobium sp. TaxID=1912891 RepID=UPI0028BDEC08|nr:cytidine deaminase [Sphingobium sp.]
MNATKKLIEAARRALAHAHAPYSRFAVGAAVRLTDGQIVTGCNFENASYGLSLCAETVALAAVNAQGRFTDVEAIAVVGGAIGADGAVSGTAIVTPCGRCRQIMNEAEQMAGRTLAIYCAAPEGDAVVEHRVAELLPHAFGPRDLGITPGKN